MYVGLETKGEPVQARPLTVAILGNLEAAVLLAHDPRGRIVAGFVAFCVHARLRVGETLCASHASPSSTFPAGPATDSSRCRPTSTRRRSGIEEVVADCCAVERDQGVRMGSGMASCALQDKYECSER